MLLNEAIKLFLEAVEARSGRRRTVGSYEQHLRSLQRFAEKHELTDLEAFSPVTLNSYVVSMRRQGTCWASHPRRPEKDGHLSEATVAGRIQTVKTFFSWCVKNRFLDHSPAEHLVKPDVDYSADGKLIDLKDLRKLEKAAKELARAGNPRDLAIVRLFADTGCREKEVRTLRLSNLNLDARTANVEGKRGMRSVEFTKRTAKAFRAWLAVRPDVEHDFVFVSRSGGRFRKGGIYQVLRRLAETSDVQGLFGSQAIRHKVGQVWTDETNLELARKKLGHKDIKTTALFYAHQDRKRVRKATRRLGLLRIARKRA
jgi:site-specific recombinase XerD